MERSTKDHRISLQEAISLTSRYREKKESLVAPDAATNLLPICETFDRSGFDLLLAQKGCVGVRAYYAMNEQDQVHLVIVGVNANGRDLLGSSEASETNNLATTEGTTADAVILDRSDRCPDYCPEPSPLNAPQ